MGQDYEQMFCID